MQFLPRLVLSALLSLLPLSFVCAGELQAEDLAVKEIAKNVYMVVGLPGEPDQHNLGRIGNAGFIVGQQGVLMIDTGTSYSQGRALLDAVRHVTDKPLKLALFTHTRQEFLFGGAAFREQHVPIAMQHEAAGLMRSRCENCLKTLRETLGENAMRGTAVLQPDIDFEDPHTLQLSELIGRPLQLLYFGHSSGPGDVAVFDPETGTLFAGGLVDNQRIPDITDGELPGWLAALKRLQALPIVTLVPGHGPAGDKHLISQEAHYLSALDARAEALLNQGTALSDVPDASSLPEFAGWDQYDIIHRRNAAIAYLRREREALLKP